MRRCRRGDAGGDVAAAGRRGIGRSRLVGVGVVGEGGIGGNPGIGVGGAREVGGVGVRTGQSRRFGCRGILRGGIGVGIVFGSCRGGRWGLDLEMVEERSLAVMMRLACRIEWRRRPPQGHHRDGRWDLGAVEHIQVVSWRTV